MNQGGGEGEEREEGGGEGRKSWLDDFMQSSYSNIGSMRPRAMEKSTSSSSPSRKRKIDLPLSAPLQFIFFFLKKAKSFTRNNDLKFNFDSDCS